MIQPITFLSEVPTFGKSIKHVLSAIFLLLLPIILPAQIDFMVANAAINPSSITIGETATLTTTVNINSTETDLSGSMGIGCLEVVISLPSSKKYLPFGGAAAVLASGFGTSFNWTYQSADNLLVGYNNVILTHGMGGLITVTLIGNSVTANPTVTTVNVNDFGDCSISNDGNNDAANAMLSVTHSVNLSCIVDTVFFYDVTSHGITIYASDLYVSATTTTNCNPLSFFLDDGFVRNRDSIRYGLNDLFIAPPCIVLTAKDNCGDSLNCKVYLQILDTLPPTIICPSPDTLCDFSEMPVPYDSITHFVGDGGIIDDETFSTFIPESFFSWIGDDTSSIGCNTLIERKFRMEDFFGNADTCSQHFVIQNKLAVTCTGPYTANNEQGFCYGILNPRPNVNVNCKIDTMFNNGPSNNHFPVGSTPIKFTVITECNDTAVCNSVVVVTDTQVPALRCPVNLTVQCIAPTAYPNVASFVAAGGVANDNCSINNTSLQASDQTTPGTCPKITTRTYTVSDVNGNTATCIQTIFIDDTVFPVITDPADITIGTSTDVCTATVALSNPLATDNCTLPLTYSRSPNGNTFSFGATTVTWTVSDACGNSSTIQQVVNVFDDEAPELTCKGPRDLNLSFADNFLTASTLVQASSDNCAGVLTIKARRMDVSCRSNAMQLRDTVFFCCADVNKTIQVVVEVSDAAGNTSTCMVAVTVKDKLIPVIEEPLRDITISCDYPFDIHDLEEFGTIVFNASDRSEIDIDDDLFQQLPGIFLDGWVNDNCPLGLVLQELSPLDQRGPHHNGNIVRRFVVTDAAGNSTTLQQTISIVDADTLTMNDIHWPLDYNYSNCSIIPPDTSMAGSPYFDNDDVCTLPASSYKDQIFDDPTSGCVYIKRTWKVIDWAQYVPNTNIGIWLHVQNIHLINTIAPVFTSPCTNKTICAVNAECDAQLSLGAHAKDDCSDAADLSYSYTIDYDNNGSVDLTGNRDTLSYRVAKGVHLITWKVDDRCGNIATCSYTVTVKECKAPTPVCINGLSTNLENNGSVPASVIWAKDFNNHSYDNCTASNDLKYSFTQNVNDISKTLTCSNKGNVNISLWVTDKDGNQSKCNTFILVTDNKSLCPTTSGGNNALTVTIAGRVATEEQAMMEAVKVNLKNELGTSTYTTDDVGTFLLADLPMFKDYEVRPENNTNWSEGVSTLDLVFIQRHILGAKKLTSPYKIIAADANADDKITASDLVALRKLILGINQEIVGNSSWRFVPKDFVFADQSNPWPFKEVLNFNAIETNNMSSDFVAIKTGDINGTVSENIKSGNASNRSSSKLDLQITDQYFEGFRYVNIPVSLSESALVNGLQMEMKIDGEVLDFVGIMNEEMNLSKDDYNYDQNSGILNLLKLYQKPLAVKEGGVLFTLQFRTLKSGKLSKCIALTDTPLKNNIVDENDKEVRLIIRFLDGMEALTVNQNTPNPFIDHTDVKFFIAEDGKVEISIYDNNGIKFYNNVQSYSSGVNMLRIDREQLGDRKGVFFLHVATGERKEIKKLLRLD